MIWAAVALYIVFKFHFFGGFLEKENPLETLIVIFENVSPKGFSWLKMKYFEISVLTANSRYLPTAALKNQTSSSVPPRIEINRIYIVLSLN